MIRGKATRTYLKTLSAVSSQIVLLPVKDICVSYYRLIRADTNFGCKVEEYFRKRNFIPRIYQLLLVSRKRQELVFQCYDAYSKDFCVSGPFWVGVLLEFYGNKTVIGALYPPTNKLHRKRIVHFYKPSSPSLF